MKIELVCLNGPMQGTRVGMFTTEHDAALAASVAPAGELWELQVQP